MIVSEKLPWPLVPSSSKLYADTDNVKPGELRIMSAEKSSKTTETVDVQSKKITKENQYQWMKTLRYVDIFA